MEAQPLAMCCPSVDFVLEHCASFEEVHIRILHAYCSALCLLYSERVRSGEIAQKTEVPGATSVDPNDRSEDAPVVAVLVKFAFDAPALVGRLVVNKGVELLGSAMRGRIGFLLPDVAYLTRDSADGVVVRGRRLSLGVD